MAAIKFSGLVTGIKGVINGSILQSNPAGYVIRTRTNGTRLSSQTWQGAKSNLAWIAGQWKDLSDAERASFATQASAYPAYDKFGNSYTPSAYQLFMTLNAGLQPAIGSFISTAIAPIAITLLSSFIVTGAVTSTLAVTYANLINGDELVAIYASPIKPYGNSFRRSEMRLIGRFDNSDTVNFNISSEYASIFYNGYSSGLIWFMIIPINTSTGQQGVPRTYPYSF